MLLVSITSLAEEDCVFDQNTRHEDNIALQKQYPGSKYIKEEYKIIIPVEDGAISINKGGCVHYGMSIELRTHKTKAFNNENSLFNKIVELATKYAKDMLEIDELKKTLYGKRWEKISSGGYVVYYEGYQAFEIYTRDEDGITIIGMSFYN